MKDCEISQIEDRYYTTMQKVSTLTNQSRGDDVKLSSEEIRERISKWTEGLQLSELQVFRLSFRLDREIVRAIVDLRNILNVALNKQTGHRGELFQIGSYAEDIKVAWAFDFDFLYIIFDKDIEVHADEQQGLYRVTRGGVEIKPRQLNSTLADCMDKIMSDISLPWPLEHGGYAGPDYSGVRFNGPAVSLQFIDKRGGDNRRVIPVDIAPVFPLPDTCKENVDVKGKVMKRLKYHLMPYVPKAGIQKVYVVSHPLTKLWQPTTACMESRIIKDLCPFSCVKIALQLTRALLCNQQKESLLQRPCVTSGDKSTEGTVDLERYTHTTDGREREAYRHQLNTKMRFQHIYLSPEVRSNFCEASKSPISVNTAAVKHAIFAHADGLEGSYRSQSGGVNVILELIRAVYKELASTESSNVNHAFLPLAISKFSILPCALHEAAHLMRTVQEECAAILDTLLKDDQVNLTVCINY